jgi:hypothetical protein
MVRTYPEGPNPYPEGIIGLSQGFLTPENEEKTDTALNEKGGIVEDKTRI